MIAAASGVAAFVLATSPVMGSETWTYIIGGIVCAAIGWSVPRLCRWLNTLRYERILVRGRGAKPGLTKIPPLGDRLTGLETGQAQLTEGQAELKVTADEHTLTLSEHGNLLHYVVGELSHNGGASFRDHVEVAAQRAEDSALAAAQAANKAHAAAIKAAELDQKVADHLGIIMDD